MRVRVVLALTALSFLALAGCGRHRGHPFASKTAPPVPGSYAESCQSITSLTKGFISARCADKAGHFKVTYIQATSCVGDISNNDGMLTCQGATGTTASPEVAASDSAASSVAP